MNRYVFYTLLVAGIAMRVFMLASYEVVDGGDVDVYLADEGVVGLMAIHISQGREWPVFFYGQDYLGALEAYCAALSFSMLGVDLLTLRLVPFLFSLAILAVVYSFAYKAYSVAAARWATAVVAVAPIYFLQWNLKARGGFVEHVFLLAVVMLLFWRFYLWHERSPRVAFALGLASGVALWVNQLMLAYLVVMAALLAIDRADRRGWGALLAGGLLGASLLLAYNVSHGGATLRALARKAVLLNRVPVEERDERWVSRGLGKRVEALADGAGKLGLVFGVPPGEGIDKLGLTAAERRGSPLTTLRRRLWPIPLLVFGAALLACLPRSGAGGWEPFGSSQLLALLAVVTIIVGYVSPRYMLPAYPMGAVMMAALVTRLSGVRRYAMVAAVTLVVLFNLAGWADATTARAASRQQPGRELIEFLETRGLTRCYSAGPLYHLVFASEERVILAPLQKDRYPAYNRAVGEAESICYVFREDQARKRQHVALMQFLESQGVSYARASVGSYRVLYDFAPRAVLSEPAVERIRNLAPSPIVVGAEGATR